ncbi:PREDICTED: uncharacterized protein LOC109193051 [Ipomoea nil]|uniref:uncharacterized protein LOC109193051 n=1 Tax=Ipomoea nil TaxID=35883 RepID=UPI000901B3FB|nr:PREDICTED: uncharacterized protein LOC109193051 [Ipomoea nil]
MASLGDLLEELRESKRRRTTARGTSCATRASTVGQRASREAAPSGSGPVSLGAPRPPPPPPRTSPARSCLDAAQARAVLQPVTLAPGAEFFRVEDAATHALEAVQRWVALADTYDATRAQVGALTQALEASRRSHRLELEKMRGELEKTRGELSRVVLTFLESDDFKIKAMSYARDHKAELVEEWLASDEGRHRVAVESLAAYEMGRFRMQDKIYTILRQQDSSFDPVNRGLPEMESNPELAALDSHVSSGGNNTREEPLDLAAFDRSVTANPLPAGSISPTLADLQFPGTLEEYAAEVTAHDVATDGPDLNA